MAGTPEVLSGTFAGRYTIERELGRGATATVYLARDTHRGRSVAIKLLKPELAQSIGADRFLREIKVNEKLHHPHIVPVLDSGEHEGMLYFVLPQMEDGSLRQMLQREKQLPVEAAVTIARTIAEALDYAHQQKLIHRDVKPENILFTSGQACLADFGIARAVERVIDESTTETGLVRGTPAYMSPEQASGSKHYDGRSDVYSLATVLYEMLAGVPAFIGPTPEAVIAQRFQHPPRELRVYRPSVPPALEAVIQKALSISPADRYATAAEFAQALAAAPRGPIVESRTSGSSLSPGRPRRIAMLGALGFMAAAVGTIGYVADWRPWARGLVADTTKYVILPFEGDSSAPTSQAYELLRQSLAAWQGVNIVDRFAMREAVGTADVISDRLAARGSQRLGAGRYLRGRVTRAGTELRVYVAAFDARSHSRLASSTASLGLSLAGADSAFAKLARLILMPQVDSTASGSRSVPAMQLFSAAMQSVNDFNLDRADSLFVAALSVDPGFARSAVWLAQVRNWQLDPVRRWLMWAETAAASTDLTPKEIRLASALVAMGRDDYRRACQIYDQLRSDNPRDFAAWYGLGQCHHRDNVVVRDRRSPSGWRFRSSYQQAVTAYARALELAPALHRGFEPGAYSRLRFVLYTMRNNVRAGATLESPTTRFISYATWSGDSLLFVPYPDSVFQVQGVRIDQQARTFAVMRQREVFARIARSWSTALPLSAGAKEAVAISLAMLGDPSARDTIRVARALASEPIHRLRLVQQDIMLHLEFGRKDSLHLRNVFQLADSVLYANRSTPSQREAEILVSIATLLGRCRHATMLAARMANANRANDLGIAPFVLALSDSLTVSWSLGCGSPADSATISQIRTGLQRGLTTQRAIQGHALEYMLLGRAMSLRLPYDSVHVTEMAARSGDPILRAQSAALAGQFDVVRDVLVRRQRWRGESGSPISPDGALEEARLWLAIGDTASARSLIDPLLTRGGWLEFLDEPVSVAALLHAAALRADVSARDDIATQGWAGMVAILWSDADDQLHAHRDRMKALLKERQEGRE